MIRLEVAKGIGPEALHEPFAKRPESKLLVRNRVSHSDLAESVFIVD